MLNLKLIAPDDTIIANINAETMRQCLVELLPLIQVYDLDTWAEFWLVYAKTMRHVENEVPGTYKESYNDLCGDQSFDLIVTIS